jgi:hypothetical protein
MERESHLVKKRLKIKENIRRGIMKYDQEFWLEEGLSMIWPLSDNSTGQTKR